MNKLLISKEELYLLLKCLKFEINLIKRTLYVSVGVELF